MNLSTLNKWEKGSIVLAMLVVGGTLGFVFFSEPSAVGYVSAAYTIQDLEVVILKNQTYTLSSKDQQPLQLKSVVVSGKVVGAGDVKIFVESLDKRYLVYSNEDKGSGLTAITGFVIKEGKEEDFEIYFVPEEETILPELREEYGDIYEEEVQAFMALLEKEVESNKNQVFADFIKTTDGQVFTNECEETCALFGLNSNNYRFIFEVDPGTVLLLDEIVYSIER